MRNRFLQGLLLVMVLIVALALYHHELLIYALRQGHGQLTIIWKAEPVEQLLVDPAFPDSLKQKLRLIEEVRRFAIDSLGLTDTKNYRTLYNQRGKEIMWVVTASEPFALVAKEWRFPVVGSVPYKGFFNESLALKEKQLLESDGWDVTIRNPGGWSTLGWFTDPILSGMLNRNEGDLASLIIHEMVHATLFVKDSVEFNENLASFIGDRGAELFLQVTYGENSTELQRYLQEEYDYQQYVEHILRGCDHLDSVYSKIRELPLSERLREKENAIRRIMLSLDTLHLVTMPVTLRNRTTSIPNNAYFMSFRRYQSRQEDLWYELNEVFHGDIRAYVQAMKKRYKSV
ncbi:MAG: aminopeptidase [Cyclobacteriaceae bacterium]|jgi:predicted aminopeptidase|nr:aminopeptidase [Cyclobacteriaceae bacterium]